MSIEEVARGSVMALSSSSIFCRAWQLNILREHSRTFTHSRTLYGLFSRKPKSHSPEQDTDVGGSERGEVRKDVLRSGYLGEYEKAALQSLADKGLGKTVLRYDPPEDVLARIGQIVGDILGKMDIREALDVKFPNRATKFRVGLPDDKNFGFLTACEAAFSHCVPSPALHEITTIAKVVEFYETPVTGTNGLTQFQQMPDLPPNLHISYEPIRFDPENDPYYGGISAFPGQSVVVQGLKARKIFKSHQAENNWPRVMDTFRRNSKVVPKYQPAERPR